MKGTDCTEDQLQSARQFLADRQTGAHQGVVHNDGRTIMLSFGDMARLLAWYGALRYVAGRRGEGGTLESPGPMDTARSGAQQ